MKIVKLNYDRKVRYIFDKDTEECERLCEQVMDHYGQFLVTPHCWYTEDIKRLQKELRTCGLSVNDFLSKQFPKQEKPVEKPKPKRKPRKSVITPKSKPGKSVITPKSKPGKSATKKTTVTKKKVPVKKPTVRKKNTKKAA